jgi:Ca2+-binding EF-hand superfamily protein
MIDEYLNEIWSSYDTDGSGALDKEEMRKLVKETLEQTGAGDNFNDDDFDKLYGESFDTDGDA